VARTAPDGGALFFGIVLLALAGALGMWLAIGNDDPQRARSLALDATEALPFSLALTDYALQNRHVVGAIAAVVAAAGVGSVGDAIGFPVISGLLRLVTGLAMLAAGGAVAAWSMLALQDPASAMEWAARTEEFMPGANEFAAAAIAAIPIVGAAAAFFIIFGLTELWRSRRGLRSLGGREAAHDHGDMRIAVPTPAPAQRSMLSTAARLDLLEPAMQSAPAAAPLAEPAIAAEPTAPASLSADPPVVQSIERMLARVSGRAPKLNAQQKAALKAFTPQQQETIARFVDLVPEGRKLAYIAIGAFVALQLIGSLVGGSR